MADIDLVFVTQNDTRPLVDNQDPTFQSTGVLTNTEVWQLRAHAVQEMFDGVSLDPFYPRADELKIVSAASIDDAFFEVDRLGSDRIRNLFFIGHGGNLDGFIFSGTPAGPGALDSFDPDSPRERFMLDVSDVVPNGSTSGGTQVSFIRKIAQKLATNSFNGIWFMSCFTGAGELPAAMEQQLKNFGARNFMILSWSDFYQTRAQGNMMPGTTASNITINGTTHNVAVPRLRTFVRWRDRIIVQGNMDVVSTASPNSVPLAQHIHGDGQASVLEPLGILPPIG